MKYESVEGNEDQSGMEPQPSIERHRHLCLKSIELATRNPGYTALSENQCSFMLPLDLGLFLFFFFFFQLRNHPQSHQQLDNVPVLCGQRLLRVLLGLLWGTFAIPIPHFLPSSVTFPPIQSWWILPIPSRPIHLAGGCTSAK